MRIDRDSGPLPCFAEYPYYVWGEVNYKSEGNCQRPTDRAWTELALENRDTGESLAIAVRDGAIEIDGPSAALAAALTAADRRDRRRGATRSRRADRARGSRGAAVLRSEPSARSRPTSRPSCAS